MATIPGELFLLFPQTDTSRLVSTALPITTIKAVMAQSRARVRILVLDCCHSGAAGRETMRGGHRPQALPLVEAARDSASIIIAACGRNVVTREQTEFGGGYLTHLFSAALDGDSAEADIDRDGLLSVTDFIEWASRQTAKLNTQRGDFIMEAPEVYGDFRSQIYLTASRFQIQDDALTIGILKQVEQIRSAFKQFPKGLMIAQLVALARPVKSAAPTFTDLQVLETLFEQNDDAAIFAAATILQVRRDPRYMSRLVGYLDDERLRPSVNWRVLRAVRDTITRYEFTAAGRRDFVSRLRKASQHRDDRTGHRFGDGSSLSLILQIIKRVKVKPEEVFSVPQLKELERKIAQSKQSK